MDDSQTLKNIERKLAALLALTVTSMFGSSEEKKNVKLETLLYNVGIETSEIANLLGKNQAAVQKAIQRAKK